MSAMRTGVLACVLLAAICLASITAAQTSWQRTYDGPGYDGGWSVQQTTDGGYIITGYTYSFGPGTPSYSNVYLVKTNASGDTLWTRTYGGARNDRGNSVQQTSDGGYIVAGFTWSFGVGADDVYFVKTDAQGDTLWTRAYGGPSNDEGYAVQQTADGGYIIAGNTNSFGVGTPDSDNVYVIKTDPSGDTLWTRTYGGPGYDEGWSVQQTTDGGYIIAGRTQSFGAGYHDVYLIRTDAQIHYVKPCLISALAGGA